jgi:hypothetical protein
MMKFSIDLNSVFLNKYQSVGSTKLSSMEICVKFHELVDASHFRVDCPECIRHRKNEISQAISQVFTYEIAVEAGIS